MGDAALPLPWEVLAPRGSAPYNLPHNLAWSLPLSSLGHLNHYLLPGMSPQRSWHGGEWGWGQHQLFFRPRPEKQGPPCLFATAHPRCQSHVSPAMQLHAPEMPAPLTATHRQARVKAVSSCPSERRSPATNRSQVAPRSTSPPPLQRHLSSHPSKHTRARTRSTTPDQRHQSFPPSPCH